MHELTADTLTDALRSCLDRSTYRDRATELARRIRADDGPAVVLSLITQLDGERGQRFSASRTDGQNDLRLEY
jgi:UDP:flavonoid glycosyltransferase YjiC (YdhE family)